MTIETNLISVSSECGVCKSGALGVFSRNSRVSNSFVCSTSKRCESPSPSKHSNSIKIQNICHSPKREDSGDQEVPAVSRNEKRFPSRLEEITTIGGIGTPPGNGTVKETKNKEKGREPN